jgi:putative membrane protein insertion efficiency factor
MKLRTCLIKLINFYQKYLSGAQVLFKNSGCVFYPTCSEYTKQAIDKYGSIKGSYLGFKRILRCHPWQKNHMDTVP